MSAEDLEGYALLARSGEPRSTLQGAWPLTGGEAGEKVMRERHGWFVEQAMGADLHFR